MPRSSAKKSSRSPKSTSSWSPTEKIAEKPIARVAAHSIMPAAMAPDCEISGEIAACGMRGREARIELAPAAPARRGNSGRRAAGRLHARRGRAASASEPGPWPRPAVMMMAAAAPFRRPPPRCSGTAAGHRDHDEVGCVGQLIHGPDGADPFDLVVVRIDEMDRAFEASVFQQYVRVRRSA